MKVDETTTKVYTYKLKWLIVLVAVRSYSLQGLWLSWRFCWWSCWVDRGSHVELEVEVDGCPCVWMY